jgi:hypothetical protein
MGHVVPLAGELRRPVHGVFQDAQKRRCDLFPAFHGRFDGGPSELSVESLELMQDFGCLHYRMSSPVRSSRIGL